MDSDLEKIHRSLPMKKRFFSAVALALGLLAAALLLRRKLGLAPGQQPVLLCPDTPAGTVRVVCAGDSLTHGVVSANYVAGLEKTFAGRDVVFLNAGINSDLSDNLLSRLDEIVACRPDVVTVLIGTNDANATFSPEIEAYFRRTKKIFVRPTLERYRENLTAIAERLRRETGARLAFLSLPMIGEALDSPLNQQLLAYNKVIREVAAAHEAAYLPLHEALAAELRAAGPRPIPFYTGGKNLIFQAAVRRYFLRQSWDAIAAAHGFTLLTDHIHLNDRAAAVVTRLIADFLDSMANR